ncbi:MAG TPA: ABC transporter permease [Gemmatimonadaceae bacterium]|nr:ABC transporter permease [Gemmatimonadaceae bacterium]
MLVHPAVAWLTTRQLLTRRRAIPVVALAALPAAIALMFAIWGGERAAAGLYAELVTTLIIPVVVPLIGLLLGGTAFGTELEEGTAIHLLARPIPRHAILFGKAIVAVPAAALLGAIAALACGVIIARGFGDDGLILASTAASAAAGALYALLFLAVGLVTRRGMLIGLLYLALWEGTLATAFAGTRVLSIRQYALSIMDHLTAVGPEVFAAPLPLSTALWMTAAVTTACAALALYRLRTFEVNEST